MKDKDNKHDISDREMCKAIDYDLNVYLDVHDGKYHTIIGQGFDSGSRLYEIIKFVRKISKSEELAFNVIKKDKRTEAIKLPLGDDYGQLTYWLDCLYQLRPEVFDQYPCHKNQQQFKLAPEIQVVLESCIEQNLQHKTFMHPLDSDAPGRIDAEVFNELIRRIRERTKSLDYKRSLHDRKNNAKRNHKSFVRYFNALLDRWSRLLVLRVDAYFPHSPSEQVGAREAHKARKRFLNNIRHNKLFSDLLGVVWKLEYGVSRGLHFHFIFIFDGRTRQKEAWITDEIGKYLTSGRYGFETYHNCNRDPNKYKQRGIGIINHYDREKRENFEKQVLGYLTKQDQYLVVAPEHGRCIGRKEMPKARTSNAGRKRKQIPVAAYAEAMAA